jgi:hypothetical protein
MLFQRHRRTPVDNQNPRVEDGHPKKQSNELKSIPKPRTVITPEWCRLHAREASVDNFWSGVPEARVEIGVFLQYHFS